MQTVKCLYGAPLLKERNPANSRRTELTPIVKDCCQNSKNTDSTFVTLVSLESSRTILVSATQHSLTFLTTLEYLLKIIFHQAWTFLLLCRKSEHCLYKEIIWTEITLYLLRNSLHKLSHSLILQKPKNINLNRVYTCFQTNPQRK